MFGAFQALYHLHFVWFQKFYKLRSLECKNRLQQNNLYVVIITISKLIKIYLFETITRTACNNNVFMCITKFSIDMVINLIPYFLSAQNAVQKCVDWNLRKNVSIPPKKLKPPIGTETYIVISYIQIFFGTVQNDEDENLLPYFLLTKSAYMSGR